MIGKNIRSLKHLHRVLGDGKKTLLARSLPRRIVLLTAERDGAKYVSVVSSGGRDEKYKFDIESRENEVTFLGTMFQEIILLPDDFFEEYNKFTTANRRALQQISSKYYMDISSWPMMYMFCLTNGSKNFFVWAAKHCWSNGIAYSTIKRVMVWNASYGKFAKNLTKGTITAYTSESDMEDLLTELFNIRQEKRANAVINSFNTRQKKLLREVELTPATINILGKFECLSRTKKQNFIRKMSTIDNAQDILKQMAFLVDVHFEWNKDSFMEYLENSEDLSFSIVKNDGDIVLLKVDDFDTIKRLGRTTSWCISKNKKYWSQYINDTVGSVQYLLFNFNKKEDDNLSIVGFTITRNRGITAAHSFTNENMLTDHRKEDRMLFSYISKYAERSGIHGFLKHNKISEDELTECDTVMFEWNHDAFFEYLEKCVGSNYMVLSDTEEKVAVVVISENVKYFLGDAYINAIPDGMTKHKHIIFADFTLPKQNPRRLMYCIVQYNYEKCEEEIFSFFDERCRSIEISLDGQLDKYSLPYDTICRTSDLSKKLVNAFNYFDIHTIKKILQCETANDVLATIKSTHLYESKILNSLVASVCTEFSSSLFDTIYECGYKISDFLGDAFVSEFGIRAIATIIDLRVGRDVPTEEDIKALHNGTLKTVEEAKYTAAFEIFNEIVNKEKNITLFVKLSRYVPRDGRINETTKYFVNKFVELLDFNDNKVITMVRPLLDLIRSNGHFGSLCDYISKQLSVKKRRRAYRGSLPF